MVKRARRQLLLIAGLPIIGLAWALACESPGSHGSCAVTSALDCGVAVDGGTTAQGWNLVGYSCNGSARPDEAPSMTEGVPNGLVCSNRGPVPDGSGNGYCCTPTTVECALDPVAPCPAPEFGYQCRGSSRPEHLNALLSCHQGVFEGDLLDYCCSSPETKVRPGCTQADGIGCQGGLIGWTCPKGYRPTQEEFGSNKSKADFYYLLCPVPEPAQNPKNDNFCCYTPALVPPGGSCVEDIGAPCAPGRFGIACYGPDSPTEDYPPLKCDPGFRGLSAQGYEAMLYCCDYVSG